MELSGPELDQECHVWYLHYECEDPLQKAFRVIQSSSKKVTWSMLFHPEDHMLGGGDAVHSLEQLAGAIPTSISYLAYMSPNEFLGEGDD